MDRAGFMYFNPEKLPEFYAQDVDPAEAEILAVVQKPFNQSIIAERSGSLLRKQLLPEVPDLLLS